jgi:1-acyl-sn-glycerol-3-phosphate acyltransferase
MDFWYTISKQILRLYLAICIRDIRVTGEENLQPGAKIIVANHPNLTDGFVLPFVIREKLHFLIQDETFRLPVLHLLLSKADQIPVCKRNGQAAIQNALDKLSAKKSVVIFPEGRLNHGRKLHRGRSGAALLAIKSGAPIQPIGFYVPPDNTRTFFSHSHGRDTMGVWQICGTCYVRIGKPWHVNLSPQINLREIRPLTEKIMAQISRLVELAKEEVEKSYNKPTRFETGTTS